MVEDGLHSLSIFVFTPSIVGGLLFCLKGLPGADVTAPAYVDGEAVLVDGAVVATGIVAVGGVLTGATVEVVVPFSGAGEP